MSTRLPVIAGAAALSLLAACSSNGVRFGIDPARLHFFDPDTGAVL